MVSGKPGLHVASSDGRLQRRQCDCSHFAKEMRALHVKGSTLSHQGVQCWLMKSEWFGRKKASLGGLKLSVVVLLLEVIALAGNRFCRRKLRCIPAAWKPANVIPVSKKGVREDPGNYRPVSPASAPVKLCIQGAIERHLKNNAIVRHSQHGLTKGKSCLIN